jgi:hypothetical protein
MKDISYHILDIVQNSLHAGADRIIISIRESIAENRFELAITDNGRGIEESMLEKVTDPFYTTGANKKVGLGLPLLKQNAEQAGGFLDIRSATGSNTTITAVFQLDHIDRLPEGDIGATLRILIAGNPQVDFVYRHEIENHEWEMDTAEIRLELERLPIQTPEVLDFIVSNLEDAVAELRKKK